MKKKILIITSGFLLLTIFVIFYILFSHKTLTCTSNSFDKSYQANIDKNFKIKFNDEGYEELIMKSTYSFEDSKRYDVFKKAFISGYNNVLNEGSFISKYEKDDDKLKFTTTITIKKKNIKKNELGSDFPNTYDEFIKYYEKNGMKCK